MNTVNVNFTQDELSALGQLLDVAVKASGLQGARPALAIYQKLEAAVAEVNAASVAAAPVEPPAHLEAAE